MSKTSSHSMSRICPLDNQPGCGSFPNVASVSSSESSYLDLLLCLHIPSSVCEEVGAFKAPTATAAPIWPSQGPPLGPLHSPQCRSGLLLGDDRRPTAFPSPLTSSLTTLGKLPNPCEPQPPHLPGGGNESIYLTGLL